MGGVSAQQIVVYDEFSRSIPGFIPSNDSTQPSGFLSKPMQVNIMLIFHRGFAFIVETTNQVITHCLYIIVYCSCLHCLYIAAALKLFLYLYFFLIYIDQVFSTSGPQTNLKRLYRFIIFPNKKSSEDDPKWLNVLHFGILLAHK